jgi:hypothetical protein
MLFCDLRILTLSISSPSFDHIYFLILPSYFLPPRSCITMLSRRVLVASRLVKAASRQGPVFRYPFPVVQQFRNYADKIVKVPEMAESISEGTLKQWSKQIGDFVEQDEEIATIETDKVRSALTCKSRMPKLS